VKKRLDILLVEKGLAPSREKARALIMAGEVSVGGLRVDKPGHVFESSQEVVLKGPGLPYVGRGGMKLEAALKEFHVEVKGKTAMDVGASTGGFTDCLLQHGSRRVYAVDVGYGQLDITLRRDPRVVVLERKNIRYLKREEIPEPVHIAVIDVSFISLKKVLPRVKEFLAPGGEVIALVKPQFEAGRKEVKRGGIIKDPLVQKRCVDEIANFAASLGLIITGEMESPLPGRDGNREFFLYINCPLPES